MEAVGILTVDPAALAAAGVSEQDTRQVWDSISGDDAGWAQYLANRDILRNALDATGQQSPEGYRESIESAETQLRLAIEAWRAAALAHLPADARVRVE